MNKKIAILGLALSLFVCGTAQAAEFIAPPKNEQNLTIGTAETHKNLYTAGANVTVNGNTLGDLVVAGGMVTVDGSVEQQLMMAGGTLSLNGSVGGNTRIAGGNITIGGPVGGDLLVGGGNINITDKSSVAGDLIIAGGNVTVDSPVAGNVRAAGGNITINSKINGNVDVRSSQKLTFGPKAEVLGKITYKGPQPASVDPAAKIPSIDFTQIQGQRQGGRAAKAIFTVAFLVKLIAWIIAGWVLLRLFKGFFYRMEERVRREPWSNLGIGLVGFIVIPIALIIMLLLVIGYYLAFIGFILYALWLAISSLAAALVVGSLIVRYLSKNPAPVPDWQVVIIGVVVWQLVRLIPIVGWIATAIVTLMVMGALLRMSRAAARPNVA